MWKPPQRIKYTAVEEDWPSRSEARDSLLFSPLQVGPVTLEQRTWVPAMVPWRSNEAGEVTEDVLQWYRRFALGKPGVIVVEATGIRDIPSGPLLRIGDDRCIPGLKQLAEVVREASEGRTRLFIQLIDFLTIRRRPDPEKYLRRFLQIEDRHRAALDMAKSSEEAVRNRLLELAPEELQQLLSAKEWEDMQQGYRERVTDTHIPAIAELPQTLPELFSSAAARAEAAGFDGVELHYAHAYTMASFLSPTNTRDDGYGGGREQRIRLPLEVYRAVRDATGADFAVGCRFLSDEIIDDGNRVDDACFFASRFAEAGMDFLSLSRGGKFDDAKQPKVGWAAYPYTGRSGYECMPGYISDPQGPFGRNIEPVAAIREALRSANQQTPVVVAGGIFSFNKAEQILQQGQADIIGFARQALADPDWFEKVRTGYGPEVIICRYSNYCEGLDQKHKQVTCELWDRLDLDEPGIAKSHDGKRRLLAPLWSPGEG
ncbi:NADH:flavin oxidoreductase [Kineobactrum salinum]|uniref:NADH:flavin oxidoreductase n=1 Tax=Kineobactrum salinum TaxID=2708301 RepID=A0A6C0U8E0_9GAMM|nr:NADH:flavin oxidoreductase [Kineobactrum salinum]QIB66775.1 NADH:flavin oxidoreductase [Kineobactrum salinum]